MLRRLSTSTNIPLDISDNELQVKAEAALGDAKALTTRGTGTYSFEHDYAYWKIDESLSVRTGIWKDYVVVDVDVYISLLG
jgi:hypothetical protein